MGRQAIKLVVAAGLWCVASPAQTASLTPRQEAQHVLRRFSFSAAPEAVTGVVNQGIPAWLASQQNWQALDDNGSELETLPTALVNGSYPDGAIFERAVVQHMILTPRQLQAKMELHWLDHFSIGQATVGDPAVMYHYDQTVRANALGNFATLLAAVANEPAMLIWLSNNYNSCPVPNENFAREAQQLYSTGIYQLNDDGSIKLNKNGQPAVNYTEKDIQNLAKAMSGFYVSFDSNNNNPQTRFSEQHYTQGNCGTIKYWGKTQKVPTDATAITYVMNQMAFRSSTAPYEVTELLQRFVTENPPPQYISDIVAVWRKTEKAPDQLSQVIAAIINHPLFNTYYQSMSKQPTEMVFGALRQVPGVMQATTNVAPGSSLLGELNALGQQMFWPPTVFSFYRPGYLSQLTNTGSIINRTRVSANITYAQQSGAYTDTYIDIPTLRSRVGSTDGGKIGAYLLDAFVDGGSDAVAQKLHGFLGKTPDDNQILGAIWLLLNSPDYAVN
jgi:uncharacterized protein (DUF1800 family)